MGNIQAATTDDVTRPSKDWVFVDLGFASKRKTCGLLVGDGTPQTLSFADLRVEVARICSVGTTALNLVLEAPLSVAFQVNGNPVGRFFEKRGKEQRYWHCPVGCSVLIAATYLLQFLHHEPLNSEVRLFEGFASFKTKGIPSSHKLDVLALRDVVRNLNEVHEGIIFPDQIRAQSGGNLVEAIGVVGMHLNVPPVILVDEARGS